MSKYKEQIIELRSKGHSYSEISDKLGCCPATVCYHLDNTQIEKKRIRRSKYHPYIKKLEFFLSKKQNQWTKNNKRLWKQVMHQKVSNFCKQQHKPNFTYQDVVKKYGEKPKCYLTGKELDIYQPSTYNFDHIVPTAKGGDNSISNLGICTRDANQSKSDMSVDEFKQLCKDVLENFGYTILEPNAKLEVQNP